MRRAVEMVGVRLPLLVLLVVGLGLTVGLPARRGEAFTIVKSMRDGELQRIVKWKGLCAREIVVDWGKTFLTLREIWSDDESTKLNMMFEERALLDCSERARGPGDQSVCAEELRYAGAAAEQNIKLGVTRYGNETADADREIPREFPWLAGSLDELRRQCAHAREAKLKDANRTAPVEGSSPGRAKRGIRELVIAPGTKWCGPHRLAYSYKDLGALDGLDRCCRRHDHCPRAIAPFSEKYGLFNYMPFTLSHCGCDERFRTCLKMTGTSSANLIGKIFFNMVQTKCFVLKPAKVCTKRSWWGKCDKHEHKKKGYLRDNHSY